MTRRFISSRDPSHSLGGLPYRRIASQRRCWKRPQNGGLRRTFENLPRIADVVTSHCYVTAVAPYGKSLSPFRTWRFQPFLSLSLSPARDPSVSSRGIFLRPTALLDRVATSRYRRGWNMRDEKTRAYDSDTSVGDTSTRRKPRCLSFKVPLSWAPLRGRRYGVRDALRDSHSCGRSLPSCQSKRVAMNHATICLHVRFGRDESSKNTIWCFRDEAYSLLWHNISLSAWKGNAIFMERMKYRPRLIALNIFKCILLTLEHSNIVSDLNLIMMLIMYAPLCVLTYIYLLHKSVITR